MATGKTARNAQEVIQPCLSGFEPLVQNALGVVQSVRCGLSRDEVSGTLPAIKYPSNGAATLIKKKCGPPEPLKTMETRRWGKNDAVRALGLQHLTMMDVDIVNDALLALKDLLIESQQERDTSRFSSDADLHQA